MVSVNYGKVVGVLDKKMKLKNKQKKKFLVSVLLTYFVSARILFNSVHCVAKISAVSPVASGSSCLRPTALSGRNCTKNT